MITNKKTQKTQTGQNRRSKSYWIKDTKDISATMVSTSRSSAPRTQRFPDDVAGLLHSIEYKWRETVERQHGNFREPPFGSPQNDKDSDDSALLVSVDDAGRRKQLHVDQLKLTECISQQYKGLVPEESSAWQVISENKTQRKRDDIPATRDNTTIGWNPITSAPKHPRFCVKITGTNVHL